MKAKNVHFYILSFLTFLIFLTTSIIFYLNYQKNLISNDIQLSIEKRLRDYEAVFAVMKTKITKTDDIKFLSPYSQKQIYLKGRADIILGEVECKIINILSGEEMSGWNIPNLELQKRLFQVTGVPLLSSAYRSLETGEELAVDIGYSFDANNFKVFLKTTIFLQDLFHYNTHPLLFIEQDPSSHSLSFFSTLYSPAELGVVIGFQIPYFFLLCTSVIAFLLYLLIIGIVVLRQQKTINKHLQEEVIHHTHALHNLVLANQQFDNLNIGKVIDIRCLNNETEFIKIAEILTEITCSYAEALSRKSITFTIKDLQDTPAIISTKKDPFVLFLSFYIDHLIQESPPNSNISCEISIDHESKDFSIARIVFEDERPFSTTSSFFSSEIKLPSSIRIPISHLMEMLGAFANPSSVSYTGNKAIIAIPYLDNNNRKIRLDSNVVLFPR